MKENIKYIKMETIKFPISNLTDEEILKEFVKRFECDGAVLIYMESSTEYGFGRWKNPNGKEWVKHLFKHIKNINQLHELKLT
ncbi:MAG TPA: hypothetical protein DER05_01025 [Lutibacter sp.]|nr:hypothetical protein [Lutibacter sp.]